MNTQGRIIEAARTCLLADGYAALSTRRVAEQAGVPLSQIHYHFGGKQGVILALLDHENQQLVQRQVRMYGAETPLWKRYEQACDFLDDDLASGYVRVLQEMMAAGWSDPQVAARVTAMLEGWFSVLVRVATEAEQRFGSLGPMRPGDVAGLIGLSFLGGEAVILLGSEDWSGRVRGWLRSVGDLIRHFEEPL
ncbi:TetR/AcrR family transcriptional regulator [Dactylosporangium sp. NPDC000521]|uniref:TetR/AcrR family transcriptional regulator n=1 Tax=Dactylosporangium sp. NPDC000521 TaxID=3363975 RepID=UPI003697943A